MHSSIRINGAALLLAVTSLLASPVAAQDAPADAPADTVEAHAWETDLIAKLSSSQAAYNNWAEGGLNTIAFTSGIQGQAVRNGGAWHQTHELRLAFGIVKQDTLDVRKSDDLIRFSSTLKYRGENFFKRFSPTLSLTGRTQFAPGFNYDKDPFNLGLRPPVKVSDFLAPATFTQSLGLTHTITQGLMQRLGVAGKQTVVSIARFRPLYGVQPDDAVRWEAGIESYTQLEREVAENIQIKSTLGLFAAFNKPDTPDLLWENLVNMKVNSWLNVNFEFVTVYDRDISDAIQLKEVLSLGVSFVLI